MSAKLLSISSWHLLSTEHTNFLSCKKFTSLSNHQIKAIVFDKTGTLTQGKPEVTHVMLFVAARVCPHQLFTAIVGLAERSSAHPLGVAITEFARKVSHRDNLYLYDQECHLSSTAIIQAVWHI